MKLEVNVAGRAKINRPPCRQTMHAFSVSSGLITLTGLASGNLSHLYDQCLFVLSVSGAFSFTHAHPDVSVGAPRGSKLWPAAQPSHTGLVQHPALTRGRQPEQSRSGLGCAWEICHTHSC